MGMAERSGGGSWIAFLCMAFVVLGLAGVFAAVASPIPLERALARIAALDQLAAASPAEAPALLDRLRPALGDSADALRPGDDLPARITAARTALPDRFLAEEADMKRRLGIILAVLTAACALFGAMVLSVVRRGR
jgi:hypothetical protein